jgi:hypothetical protein
MIFVCFKIEDLNVFTSLAHQITQRFQIFFVEAVEKTSIFILPNIEKSKAKATLCDMDLRCDQAGMIFCAKSSRSTRDLFNLRGRQS